VETDTLAAESLWIECGTLWKAEGRIGSRPVFCTTPRVCRAGRRFFSTDVPFQESTLSAIFSQKEPPHHHKIEVLDSGIFQGAG